MQHTHHHVYYISPSSMPSRAANTIHAANMCEGLNQTGRRVSFFMHSTVLDAESCKKELNDFYGIHTGQITPVVAGGRAERGIELRIALSALWHFLLDSLGFNRPVCVISRNLYAAVFLGLILRQKVVYETHSPEYGLRKKLQRRLLISKHIPCVVISQALQDIIFASHGIKQNNTVMVLHDAARALQKPMTEGQKKAAQERFLKDEILSPAFKKLAGYFGHLYEGRGIEIIYELSAAFPDIGFFVYGGNDADIKTHRKRNSNKNLFFMGHLPPAKVRQAMAMMDMLLMPYQKSVSVGLEGVDTAQWMSPMKLFEYMSVGVPIISSDLPVLREVLIHRNNSMLAQPKNVPSWVSAVRQLLVSPDLAEKIGRKAYGEFSRNYTWEQRARKMLAQVGELD